MPYVNKDERDYQRRGLPPAEPGALNYAFTQVIKSYIEARAKLDGRPLSYKVINDIIGALEGAKLEFYRRVVVPYEDVKMQENGDVY